MASKEGKIRKSPQGGPVCVASKRRHMAHTLIQNFRLEKLGVTIGCMNRATMVKNIVAGIHESNRHDAPDRPALTSSRRPNCSLVKERVGRSSMVLVTSADADPPLRRSRGILLIFGPLSRAAGQVFGKFCPGLFAGATPTGCTGLASWMSAKPGILPRVNLKASPHRQQNPGGVQPRVKSVFRGSAAAITAR